jgi:hypothetical protein
MLPGTLVCAGEDAHILILFQASISLTMQDVIATILIASTYVM